MFLSSPGQKRPHQSPEHPSHASLPPATWRGATCSAAPAGAEVTRNIADLVDRRITLQTL